MSRRVKLGWAIVAFDVAAATAMGLWHLWWQAAIVLASAAWMVREVRRMTRLGR